MGNFWLKTWLWIKVVFFGLIFIYVLAFVVENLDNKAPVWYSLHKEASPSVLLLALIAFATGVACTILVRTTLITLRQFRQVKERNRQEKLHRDVEEIKAKATLSMLQPKPTPMHPGDSDDET